MVPGCIYIIYSKEELDKLKELNDFLVIKIHYKKRKWYNFWKKQINYYEIMCTK